MMRSRYEAYQGDASQGRVMNPFWKYFLDHEMSKKAREKGVLKGNLK